MRAHTQDRNTTPLEHDRCPVAAIHKRLYVRRLGAQAAGENGVPGERRRSGWFGNGFAVAADKGIAACTSMISTSRLSKSQTARSA